MKKIALLLISTIFIYANWNLYPTYPRYLQKSKDVLSMFFFKANTDQKIVALTFDDGPNRYTPKIMKVLQQNQAPATFFLVAKKLTKKYDYLYNNPLFTPAMHTFSHKKFDKLTTKQIEADFQKAIANFKKHHLNYDLFRPAYGVVNKRLASILQQKRIVPILWSNDTKDWNKRRKNYKRVIDKLSSGDIILMHDHATTPKELDRLIKNIRAKGFTIVPVKELLNYPSSFPIKL